MIFPADPQPGQLVLCDRQKQDKHGRLMVDLHGNRIPCRRPLGTWQADGTILSRDHNIGTGRSLLVEHACTKHRQ